MDFCNNIKKRIGPNDKSATLFTKCAIPYFTYLGPMGITHFVGMYFSQLRLNKTSRLAPALGVTEFIIVTDMILVTLCCAT